MPSRAFAVVGAGISATVLAAAGITYASPAESTPVSAPVHRAAQPLHHRAQPAHPAAQPVQHAASAASARALSDTKNGEEGRNGGRDDEGGRDDGGRDRGGRDDGGHDRGGHDRGGHDGDGGHRHGHRRAGRIFINERSYPAFVEGCITAASGLGAHSFNVRNESRRTVEVFRGLNCDGGAPVAIVGPRSETFGVMPHRHDGDGDGEFGHHGVVGSFRVVCDHDGRW